MKGRIPRQFIDTLLARSDIVDVVGARVPLKKAGKDLMACCPFHDEKTPSFSVSPSKQFYYCFGCGAHGNALDFLMEYDRIGFVDAVETLANLAGIEVPREAFATQGPDHRPLYQLLDEIAAWYREQLRTHPDAIAYLKQRGLSGEISARFAIGYAPSGWDRLLKRFGTQADQIARLVESGMLIDNEGKRYDRFRERIMFPIRDSRGRVVGFGGRLTGDGKPKYLNSPETPLFHKSEALYGLYEARQALRRLDRLLVVEGYMDVVALAQYGIDYAVATLGTAATNRHIELLFRHAPSVCFCFDGDDAGRAAAWKALNHLLPMMRDGREARFLFLPEGEDPDSLVRQEGRETFEDRIVHAKPLSDYLFEHSAEGIDLGSADGKARYAEQLRPLLERLPGGLFRQMLFKRLDDLLGLRAHAAHGAPARRAGPRPPRPLTMNATRIAIALLLRHPRLGHDPELVTDWADAGIPGTDFLLRLLEIIREQPEISPARLLEHYRGSDEEPIVRRLFAAPLSIQETGAEAVSDESLRAELRGALQRLSDKARRERIRQRIRGQPPA